MSETPRFVRASPYQEDVLGLPVTDLDVASKWYSEHFGMTEVGRREMPVPSVILERDGVQIGFAINGGDASQDGASVLVTNIHSLREELLAKGANAGDFRVDDRDGEEFNVFFVIAPDGLCFYFHESVENVS